AAIPVPGSRVAAWAAGTAASGAVAYNMTVYQITQQYLEIKNEEMIAERGRGLTQAEETKLKDDFASLARRYGLWEAIPEAVSNLAFVGILTAPLSSMFGRNIATQIVAKISGLYGQELLTETITQKGQSQVEIEAGFREGSITWVEAFKEIAPQTFLLTTILAGAGQVIISSRNALTKTEDSLKGEIGEDHSMFKDFIEKIRTQFTEAIKDERGGIGLPQRPSELTPEESSAVERFLAVPEGELAIPTEAVFKALEVRGFTDRFIDTKEMKRILHLPIPTEITTQPVPEAVSGVPIVHRGTEPEGISIGDELGVRYDGMFEAVSDVAAQMSFTDVQQTKDTFTARSLEEARTKLAAMREAFAEAAALEGLPPEEIKTRMTEKPLPAKEDVAVEVVRQQALIPGQPKLTIEQIDALTGFFADYINNPTTVSAWELTRELRRETRAGRAEELKARTQALMVEEGLGYEQAID
ncbi:hypothetical protein LCGC14_2583190, partial [marine sediment metagenome]